MNTRTKSILIIAGAIFGGILIGALSVGAVVNYRMGQLQQLRRPAGFTGIVEDVLQPQSSEQRAEIREALRKAAERNVALRRSMRRQHLALLDSLRSDLSEILSPEQMQRLEEWTERQKRPMRFRNDDRTRGRRFGGRGAPERRGGIGPPVQPPVDSTAAPSDTAGGRQDGR